MQRLVNKYAQKLADAGLVERDGALVAGLDARFVFNREEGAEFAEQIMRRVNINSLVLAAPAEPFRSIIAFLAGRETGEEAAIQPQDCETRTFLHDLPVRRERTPEAVAETLKKRKSVILAPSGAGENETPPLIVAFGTVSPEQAFVTYSSVCFACFVKFFSDYLKALKLGEVDEEYRRAFQRISGLLAPPRETPPELASGPFASESEVYAAMHVAGRKTVEYGLVDSYFGNISYLFNDTLFISQTGSSLDELEGHIDPVPLNGASCAGITASSELTAHLEVMNKAGVRAILHGHPRFSVILSMDCDRRECPDMGRCHIACTEEREVCGLKIVPGEVGVGPTGLCNTLPPAVVGREGAIVYGHGLFTVSGSDFNEAFARLLHSENMCRRVYFERVAALEGAQ